MFERTVLAALALSLFPLQGAAQDWREVTSFRQRSAETTMDVHVRYGAGTLAIGPGQAGELYRVDMRYDSDAFEPVTRYEAGALEVGVEGLGSGVKLRNTKGGDLKLSLSPDVPLDLDLDFGAVEATLELGGLRIMELSVETGASDTQLRFSEPNPDVCSRLGIAMGAAALQVRGLGNANCSRIMVEGGVGDIELDFSGPWRQDMEADITMALGSTTLRVPDNVGVRVEKAAILTSFSAARFHRRDGVYYSDNWDAAERKLTVDLEGAFGSIDIRWLAASATP